MEFYAHTKTRPDGNSAPQNEWEPLSTPFGKSPDECQRESCKNCERLEPNHGHLNKVAWWTAKFASEMFSADSAESKSAREWGYLAGLWHDLGKFAPEWQTYLASKADPHEAEVSSKLDHATAGAQFAVRSHPILGHLLAYPMACHHSGLLDATSNYACLADRLKKLGLPEIPEIPASLSSENVPPLPLFLTRDGYSISFFTRMIFSCLVDADFLATEAFMNPSQALARHHSSGDLAEICRLVESRIEAFGRPAPNDNVAIQRRKVVEDCRTAATNAPGIFTLTVPTGGGKTLSSLNFALRHALAHEQTRVIYVVPFTSIIEQNAEVIREILAPLQTDTFSPLIEHHSALSPEKETTQSRLAAENWDAPIIITTAVQFYESLFAAKTSRSRKLHHIANSVIILDEAQAIPVDFLSPCLRVLQEISAHYRSTVVLCTATQPAVRHHETEFPIGLENAREIIKNTQALFSALKRVEVEFIGPIPNTTLAARLLEHDQVLCVVNRRKQAQEIYRLIGKSPENFHLSALMCPEHRSQILRKTRERLEKKQPVRVISTQLIEAGVDVDFPVVYRSLAGLDSIAQAAGRCNRNGKLPIGHTYIFEAEDTKGETYFRETAQVTKQLLDLHPDLLGEDAIHHYFDLYYYQQKARWDSKDILPGFRLDQGDKSLPFKFQYRTTAENFRLIDDWQVPVIIPFDENARSLISQLRNPTIPLHRHLLRALQRYVVQISPRLRDENIRSFEILRDGQFHVLISTELNYSKDFGITFDDQDTGSADLVCG